MFFKCFQFFFSVLHKYQAYFFHCRKRDGYFKTTALQRNEINKIIYSSDRYINIYQ